MSALEVLDVSVMRGDTRACKNVNLTVGNGETLALLGPSGSGKTSLLRAIAGIEPICGGSIKFDDIDLAGMDVARRGFGVMFQDLALFPNLDVAGNIGYPLRVRNVDKDQARATVSRLLEDVGLVGMEHRSVGELSGGERQRVALARALASDPRLLLLDEPLGSLDRLLRERLAVDLRRSLSSSGLASIVVTHDHDEAFLLADTVVLMREGSVVQQGTPADVWRAPADEWVSDFIGNPSATTVERCDGELLTPWGPVTSPGADRTVRLSVPPSAVTLDPDGEWSARVCAVRPNRDYLKIEVEGTDRAVLAVSSDEPVAVGTMVRLRVRVERLVLFDI